MQEYLTHRRFLIPYIAQQIKAKTYLEIGVRNGRTFYPIRVRKKVAVDPVFKIKKDVKQHHSIRYWPNLIAKFFECTSDTFFEQYVNKVFKKGSLDLAFIDGLHTAEQTLKDVENTLPFMSENGIIILHDCSPRSESAAYPANSIEEVKKINPSGFDGKWSGDVWKVVPILKNKFGDLSIFTIDHDSGIGIVSKTDLFNGHDVFNTNEKFDNQTILNSDYNYLDENRYQLLNLLDDRTIIRKCRLFNG